MCLLLNGFNHPGANAEQVVEGVGVVFQRGGFSHLRFALQTESGGVNAVALPFYGEVALGPFLRLGLLAEGFLLLCDGGVGLGELGLQRLHLLLELGSGGLFRGVLRGGHILSTVVG